MQVLAFVSLFIYSHNRISSFGFISISYFSITIRHHLPLQMLSGIFQLLLCLSARTVLHFSFKGLESACLTQLLKQNFYGVFQKLGLKLLIGYSCICQRAALLFGIKPYQLQILLSPSTLLSSVSKNKNFHLEYKFDLQFSRRKFWPLILRHHWE